MSVRMINEYKYRILLTVFGILLAVFIMYPTETSVAGKPSDTEITACATQPPKSYTQFVASDFNLINVDVDPTTKFLTLNTGNQALNVNNIVVPFDQEVSVTFVYENSGFRLTKFGWLLGSDVDSNGKPITSKIRWVYTGINDDNKDGVLDANAGLGDRNGDSSSDARDNKEFLGKFQAGTELVFVIDSSNNISYYTNGKPTDDRGGIFYTKKTWNETAKASLGGIQRMIHYYDDMRLDGSGGDIDASGKPITAGAGCEKYARNDKKNSACGSGCGSNTQVQGWLDKSARDRLRSLFGLNFDAVVEGNTLCIDEAYDTPSAHFVVVAPAQNPNAWIVGVDDQRHDTNYSVVATPPWTGSDADYNDIVFIIERKTGGTAALTSAQAIKPSDTAAYFTGVTFEVYDDMPCAGKTDINYSVSPDGGTTWIDILAWDEIYTSDVNKSKGAAVSNWSPGKPEYTLRRVTIDFLSSGKVGQAFLWKAAMVSDSETCAPRIMGVNLGFSIAKHGTFARSAPVTMVNILYSGSYETPDPNDATWTDMTLRGHLIYTRLYQPDDPTKTAINPKVIDAGAVLAARAVSSRKIYYPDVTMVSITETIGKGDSTDGSTGTKTFTGKISHQPMQDGSLVITDGTEKFAEDTGDVLTGSFGGSGTIDRFTGEFTVTFKNPPWVNVPVTATYTYYNIASTLKSFETGAGITPTMLGLTSDWSYSATGAVVYDNDFNKDGKMDQNDADWLVKWIRGYKDGVSTQKSWPLGAIDHSTPAVDVPPGKPAWYYGTATTDDEREVYKAFADANADRRATVYVGARDGMLHAFDAGLFKWGDNPKTTSITENIGYFVWSGNTPSDTDYGTAEERWAFIPVNLLGRLKNNYKGTNKQAYVDASPTVADVYINDKWVTILLTAEGDGGDTVVCLDITAPNNPKFLWEYANTELYRSKSSPSVARLAKIKSGGETKWVAFFVSATSNPAKYPAIYVVDIANGALIKKVYLYAAEMGTTGLGGIPSGQPAVVDFDGDGYADRLYIGANSNLNQGIGNGYLYKVNITGDDTWPTCILNSSISNPLPIFGTPVAVVERGYDDDGNPIEGVKIFYGTGDSPYKNDDVSASTVFSFYGFEDNDSNTTCTPITEGPSFQMDFDPGEKVWTSAFASAGQIYFGTTTADTEDPCDGYGTSTSAAANVYVLGETESGEMQVVHKIEDTPNNNVPPVVDDGHLYIRGPDGKIRSYGSGRYNNARNIYGVAQPPRQKTWREVY